MGGKTSLHHDSVYSDHYPSNRASGSSIFKVNPEGVSVLAGRLRRQRQVKTIRPLLEMKFGIGADQVDRFDCPIVQSGAAEGVNHRFSAQRPT